MSEKNVKLVLRADAASNFLFGLVLQLYLEPVLPLIGWVGTETPVYAMVLGSALIGLALAVWFAANHPYQSRDTILASIVAKCLAGATILYTVLMGQIALPSPWLLPAAVVVQVLFVIGEAAYLLVSRPQKVA